MTYKLAFVPSAQKEWNKLGHTLKAQLKNKLAQRLENPHIDKDRLNAANLYKIKLPASGYRLVYQVNDHNVIVLELAIGKRNRSDVYRLTAARQ